MNNTDLKQTYLGHGYFHYKHMVLAAQELANRIDSEIMGEYMNNTDLKQRYDKMHSIGKIEWFDDGKAERQAIVDMGKPWYNKRVLEIGCGEGELLDMINEKHACTTGIDYSLEAITTAKKRFSHLDVMCCDLKEWPDSRKQKFNVIVMQGVLEHMDDWRESLSGIIEKFKPQTVITSMPAFLNIRGIIWHTLDMLGAVMSKTDLHYIDPWQVQEFCAFQEGYPSVEWQTIEHDWGNGKKMLEDLHTRIPLALKDGGIPVDMLSINKLLEWLEKALEYFDHDEGAVNVYRIDI